MSAPTYLQKPGDVKPWDFVLYVPCHAHNDMQHPDCEDGVVSSTNDWYVFVKFVGRLSPQACKPDQLVRR